MRSAVAAMASPAARHAHDTPRARRRHRLPSTSAPTALQASKQNSTNETACSVPPAASVNRWMSASSTHRNALPSARRCSCRTDETSDRRHGARRSGRARAGPRRPGPTTDPVPRVQSLAGPWCSERSTDARRGPVSGRRWPVAPSCAGSSSSRARSGGSPGPHESSAGSRSSPSATSSGIGDVRTTTM